MVAHQFALAARRRVAGVSAGGQCAARLGAVRRCECVVAHADGERQQREAASQTADVAVLAQRAAAAAAAARHRAAADVGACDCGAEQQHKHARQQQQQCATRRRRCSRLGELCGRRRSATGGGAARLLGARTAGRHRRRAAAPRRPHQLGGVARLLVRRPSPGVGVVGHDSAHLGCARWRLARHTQRSPTAAHRCALGQSRLVKGTRAFSTAFAD